MATYPKLFALASVASTLAACGTADQATLPDPSEAPTNVLFGTADMVGPNGATLGTVEMQKVTSGIELKLKATGLEPGEKAFHLHTVGDCSAADFTSAGGHLNPEGHTHGALSDGGQHLGDLPNISVDETGSVNTEVLLETTLQDLPSVIFDEDGTAVMLHAGPDDYLTDPAGAAGPRIACGVVQSPEG
ncbi:superoxide dismutase family protein [Erythrobacter sp. MTPC3]|uniref:superoxide dismutase family protein n=1 Tax=Erythrobacter sp. MTPC3 TaxID=3056564 RepID=UPI0036F23030